MTWSNRSFKWSIKDFGAPLLDSITGGTYSKLDVFREYVQNAVDSYADFQRLTGITPQNDVQVRVDGRNDSLSIMDYGLGMDWDDIDTAKKIAVSPKLERNAEFVGFRGIGIWSGLSACEKLVITTTKHGVPYEYRLTIDCKGIVERISTPIPIDELLEDRVLIEERAGDRDEHFTRVALYAVNRESFGELLDPKKLRVYAEQNLPVPFEPEWKDDKGVSYTDMVTQLLEDVPWTTTYNLTIDSQSVYRRFPSTKNIQFPTKEIIRDSKEREVAVAWVSETRRSEGSKKGTIDISDGSVRNFAIRVKNFVVGERGIYSEAATDSNNLDWYVGEIYITDPDVRPDTKRSKFQSNDRHDEVISAIIKFYSSTALRARALSQRLAVLLKCTNTRTTISELQNILSQGTLDDFSRGRYQVKAQDLLDGLLLTRRDLENVLQEINKNDNQEVERVRITRQYLRKKEVREAIETSIGQVNAFLSTWNDALKELETDQAITSDSQAGKAKRQSRARTKALKGTPVETSIVLGKPAESVLTAPDENLDRTTTNQQSIDLETAIDAFKAALAAVIGENSEVYRRIVDRIPEELRRRGINA